VPGLRQVFVRPVTSFRNISSECVVVHGKEFELLYDKLDDNVVYLLEVEFDIEDPKFIDRLVHRKVQDDDMGDEEKRRYWMHAQLRFVKGLEKLFSNVRVYDLNFDVNVAVHEDIRVSIPSTFRKELEVVVKWLRETDRERKHRLSRAHMILLRKRGKVKSDILEMLRQLQRLFLPVTFRKFIDVGMDFRYYDCRRGTDYYSAPFPTWPKLMIVTTRTDLSIDKPAAKGYLDFYCKQFKLEIGHISHQYYGT